jgi:excisionase family DNA binding protein
MAANDSPRLLDVKQTATLLHVSPATVRRRIAAGELEAFRVGRDGKVRIRERSLDELLVRYERKGQA